MPWILSTQNDAQFVYKSCKIMPVPRYTIVLVSLIGCACLLYINQHGQITISSPHNQRHSPLPNEDDPSRNEYINNDIFNSSHFPFNECICKMVKQKHANEARHQFETVLPWLNKTTLQDLDARHPNFPGHFLYNATLDKVCKLIPNVLSISWKNKHWQEAVIGHDKKLHLYSASYDPNKGGGSPSVQVLAMSREVNLGQPLCQIWYSTHTPPTITTTSQIVHIDYQGKSKNRQMPYMLTCPLPTAMGTTDAPAAVSIVNSPCTHANNLLKVEGAREREPSAYSSGSVPKDPQSVKEGWMAAVCGPALYYYSQDFSWRLVEWLELLRAMGFGRVFLYDNGVHPNITKVLRYYQRDGFVQITDYQYPPPYINEPGMKRLWTLVERPKMFSQENIYFTDCLLRHMHQYRFIVHLDPDEMPILQNYQNFTELLDSLISTIPPQGGYRLRWNIFYDDFEPKGPSAGLPKHFWILRHTFRPTKDMSSSVGTMKSVYDMDTARAVFSHGVLWCSSGKCSHSKMPIVPIDSGYLAHFTRRCKDNKSGDSCTAIKEDLSLLKYKDTVAPAVEKILRELKLLDL